MKSSRFTSILGQMLQPGRLRPDMLGISLALVLLSGCTTPGTGNRISSPSFRPTNVHLAQKQLPAQLRRIAVLPLTIRMNDSNSESGRENLQPILLAELSKTRLLDTTFVEETDLQRWSGRTRWSAEERLPVGLLKKIREETGADGVLFSEMTTYRPYSPLSVGWRFKLVDCQEARIWWSIDEVFDAGDPMVANAARSYYRDQMQQPNSLYDPQSILASPRRFGQYTLHAVFATLPSR